MIRVALTALVVLLGVATGLPLFQTDVWWVRLLDFPRMQIAAALLAALAAIWWVGGRWIWVVPVALTATVALGLQLSALWSYQPFTGQMARGGAVCAAEDRLRVLVANVQRGNRAADEVIDLARREAPDLFLVMETDERWDRALSPLDAQFAHRMQAIPGGASYYGMHLFSRHALSGAGFVYPFDQTAPMLDITVAHPAERIHFIGLHPRPPTVLDQPSTIRDATILDAALRAADGRDTAIVAGDLNAAPWERTAQRALRLGALIDPRVGRGPFVTFSATSLWMKWPLDQVLWQEGPGLIGFKVLGAIGSDHYPVRVDLCLGADAADRQRTFPLRPDDFARTRATFDAAAALPRLD